jgi:hypothetical protein
MRAILHGIEDEAQARRALEEIERLIADADATGMQLDPWLAELAEELRAVVPAVDAETAAKIARRIAAAPNISIAAQSRLRSETVRVLKGLKG